MGRKARIMALAAIGYSLGRWRISDEARYPHDPSRRWTVRPRPTSWTDFVVELWRQTDEDRLFAVAASVAFFALASFAPALTVIVSLYGLVGDPNMVVQGISDFGSFLPSQVVQIAADQAVRVASQPTSALSLKLLFGLAVATWSTRAAVNAMFDALNVINNRVESRSFMNLAAVALLVTFGAAVAIATAVLTIGSAPELLVTLQLSPRAAATVLLAKWPALFALSVVGLVVLYRVGTSGRVLHVTSLWRGALLAALAISLTSAAFSWYVSALGDYTATYGSLATIIVFMTWLWLSISIILLGAEFNHVRAFMRGE